MTVLQYILNFYSFECNPNTIHICKDRLNSYPNIMFQPLGLGDEEKKLPFFSYIKSTVGNIASMFCVGLFLSLFHRFF